VNVIREYNPELKRWSTPPASNDYNVRVPEGQGEPFLRCFDSAAPRERMPRIPYIIKNGDTFYDIAETFHIRRRELHALNKGINPRRLRPGSIIYLPPHADRTGTEHYLRSDVKSATPYIIQKGDTLFDIAKKYGVSRTRLYALNQDINPRRLRPGSIIYLPYRN
jgi:membrane-bound lytic murein transglycosylase D